MGVSSFLGLGFMFITYNPDTPALQLLHNNSYTTADNEMINGTLIPGTVTVNDTVGSDGSLAFDSGIMNGEWSGLPNRFDGLVLSIPANGNYPLVTGGQTYNGTFSYTFNIPIVVYLTQVIDTALSFNEQGGPYEFYSDSVDFPAGDDPAANKTCPGPSTAPAFTAAILGMTLTLLSGIYWLRTLCTLVTLE
jgi:hypothetical protein